MSAERPIRRSASAHFFNLMGLLALRLGRIALRTYGAMHEVSVRRKA